NISSGYFGAFDLDQDTSTSSESTAKIAKKLGLCVDVQPATLQYLYGILEAATEVYTTKNWRKMEENLCLWTIATSMRLLKAHLFTILHNRIPEEDAGLTPALKSSIYALITKILEFKDSSKTHELIVREAVLTLVHCFSVFYSSRESCLSFIEERLADMKTGKKVADEIGKMYDLIFARISSPANLSKALVVSDEASAGAVRALLTTTLELVEKSSSVQIRTGANENPALLQFLCNV
ncbi:MAG: hypothetical protein V2I33_23785, partial [Kangiellaceae bacterium]|nr:hypothetical protein [Kangiellaceae bacterium]